MGKYTLYPRPERFKAEEWSKDRCCRRSCCQIDLITVLIAGYETHYKEQWSHCLAQKWSLGDCVAGCRNEEYDIEGLIEQRRHSHQSQLARKPVSMASKILEDADRASEAEDADSKKVWFANFEALHDDLRSKLKNLDGIDDLTIYDTALRIGWNKNPQLLPKEYVYLHRGAMEGALALQKISEITGKKYFSYEGKPGYRVEISHFRKDFQKLGANYLEDFLCVFHHILRYWAEGEERDAEKDRLRKEKKNLKMKR